MIDAAGASSRRFPVEVDPTVNLESQLVCNIKKTVWSSADGDAGGDCESGIRSGAEITRARLETTSDEFTAYPLTQGFTTAASWDQDGVS